MLIYFLEPVAVPGLQVGISKIFFSKSLLWVLGNIIYFLLD